ncbi:DNA polymerase IV [Treponema sp.]|uniref:DNA polymerase IV n=1 Tax=Treponema sp. TaxID=166 RepID=UPI0025ED53E1|nr:DNA polymerase IV [Treponema sp.]MCR5218760.1 DNA polymerase IV [Treponema sp.]
MNADSSNKTYFHVDLDAFFASVEQRDHPEYKGKPVIIGGLPGDRRAVVSTASYEARKYGVHSAMPLSKAVELCPQAVFIRGNYKRYSEISHRIMSIFSNFSPVVIQMSIDEAFIDMTGTEKLFGPAESAALKIKKEILEQTGLTVSIGVSSSMYVAKIASGYKKPDGLTIIPPGDEEKFMLSLPLDKLWGAGSKTQAHLKEIGLTTIRDIHSKSLNLLISIFGQSAGSFLYNAVRGNKDYIFGTEAKSHSISTESTFEFDLTDRNSIEKALMELCWNLMWRLHKENLRSRTIMVKIRYEDFTTISVQESFTNPVSSSDDLYEKTMYLFNKKYDGSSGIRLLGICACNTESRDLPVQQNLFDFGEEKKARLEKAIYNLEEKNPSLKVRKARLLSD